MPAVQHLITGASVAVRGRLVASQGQGQKWELTAEEVTIVGPSDAGYPLQKKGHTPEFLREIAHLRPRSNLFGAIFRTRSRLAFAVHRFFQERGFVYVHAPIVTGSDCEGAGELFRVTTLDPASPPKRPDGSVDFSQDFFARPTYLTVSGQLEAEAFACALSKVYTFGPTFRAENSNTSRHASEFWMIEPEMAFCDLAGDMDLAEEFVKALIREARTGCAEDLELFGKFVDKELLARLDFVLERPFQRVSYTEAVKLLVESGKSFRVPGRLRHQPPVGARAVPDRGRVQVPGDRLQLPEGDQALLHAAQRRRPDGDGDGCPGARDRRDRRRQPARGAPGRPRGEHAPPRPRSKGLRLVPGPAPVGHRAARGLRPRVRADADVRHGRLEHPRRDPVRPHARATRRF